LPDFKTLPPGIRSSLEKLAGVSLDDDDPDSDEDAPIEKKPRKRRRG
jgi:hypothetical protein